MQFWKNYFNEHKKYIDKKLLNSLKKLFNQTDVNTAESVGELYLLCGIMMEAANIDGSVDKEETDKISKVLVENFNEDAADVSNVIEKCMNELSDNKSLHFFTSRINKTFENEKKIILIEILWEIILADGKIHDFESNLIRRLAGLLYVSDYECGKAKQKTLAKLQSNI
ncbi:TerB family tellurite resistance protein [Alphaproteobacteria bacterium]|nr:TerB family tellurite resistance protein [Alphaproteobacteria bacterium]